MISSQLINGRGSGGSTDGGWHVCSNTEKMVKRKNVKNIPGTRFLCQTRKVSDSGVFPKAFPS